LQSLPLKVSLKPDTRFIASRADFTDWAEGRKQLRMEYFYREMRRKTGLLMEGGKPAGDKWNFDHDNRKAPPREITCAGPMQFTPDAETDEVLDLVEERFGDHFGELRPFHFAVTRSDALRALEQFIREGLPLFGDYQDAMLRGEKWLYHSVLSPYLNIGLLEPLEV
jgi:deoxyribodipyrimidine photolyase-related protein